MLTRSRLQLTLQQPLQTLESQGLPKQGSERLCFAQQ